LSSNIINLNRTVSSARLPAEFPHGGGVEAAANRWQCDTSEVLDISTGLHPAGAPLWLPEWLQAHASLVAHYPETAGEPARSVLADEFGVAPENVLITAGAQAVIEVVFQAMGWKSMAIEVPCYSEPIRCAKRAGCQVHPFDTGEVMPETEAFWLTSPSNPFGDQKSFPEECVGVLDESYMPFSQRRTMGLLSKVIRLGSLTKSFCIPGLRLGYVIADAETVERLNQWLPPWPASTLGLHLLPRLLQEADQRDGQVVVGRDRLASLLSSFGWEVRFSEASFLMARPNSSMPDFAAERILVRAFPEWPQLKGWIRFGLPGDEKGWKRLEKALCQSH